MKNVRLVLKGEGLKFFKNQKGFTLVELLVVVAILGVLAAVTVSNVTNFMNKGDESAIKANTASIQTAVDAYVADGGGHKYADLTQAASPSVPAALVPDYLRSQPSIGNYSISATGAVVGTP